MYYTGQGIVQDFKEAMKLFRLAAGQGHTEAQNNMGLMYAKGQGVSQDYKEAVKWWRLAAEQGIAEAQNNLDLILKKKGVWGKVKDFFNCFFIQMNPVLFCIGTQNANEL